MSERMKFPGDEFVLRMHIEFVGEDDEPGRRDAEEKRSRIPRVRFEATDDSFRIHRIPGVRRPVG